MQLPKLWVVGLAIVTAIIVGVVGLSMVQPSGDLIQSAEFTIDRITPNADLKDDITEFRYTLSRNAHISLTFENEAGQQFAFRDGERRVADDYSVLFSGVVDAFKLEGEEGFRLSSESGNLPILEKRLIPDGLYTWTLTAVDDEGETATQTGTLEIAESDSELPLIQAFEVGPDLFFTPNQDGIHDRITINIFLAKPANLQVFLADETGEPTTYLARREGGRETGEEGSHEFDYDGGVDQGFRPPPNGEYTIVAVAQDDEGQRTRQIATLTIADSGLPQVEIMPQSSGSTVCFQDMPYNDAYFTDIETEGEKLDNPTTICSDRTTLSVKQGDMLLFHTFIRNYGDTPIRTAGPFPGTVYQFDQRASSLGEYEESGAWRIGINCETSMSDYPWRWALAAPDQLTAVYDEQLDTTLYYLEPGQRVEVWGAVRLTDIIESRNPQNCWAGLIHEDVRVPPSQNNIGRREVKIEPVE